jgi:hypothetical protein
MGPKKYRCPASETRAYDGVITNQKPLYFLKRSYPFVTVGDMGADSFADPWAFD